jgi:hypothetical protein
MRMHIRAVQLMPREFDIMVPITRALRLGSLIVFRDRHRTIHGESARCGTKDVHLSASH